MNYFFGVLRGFFERSFGFVYIVVSEAKVVYFINVRVLFYAFAKCTSLTRIQHEPCCNI